MKMIGIFKSRYLFFLTLTIMFMHNIVLAQELAWEKISSKNVTLFYPGISSWEFLLSSDHKVGGRNIRLGKKSCVDCHVSKGGDFDLLADEIVSGKLRMNHTQQFFETDPVPNKKGFLIASVQVMFDKEYLYLRITWQSQGASWHDQALAKDGLADRVSIQVNKAEGPFRKSGCFITCHNDLNGMPKSPSREVIRKHPYYKSMGREDIRLYSDNTRNGGWAELKNKREIEKLLYEGGLIDLWKAEFTGKNLSVKDGWILEDRRDDDITDVTGNGHWEDGRYTVVMKKKMNSGDSRDVQLIKGDKLTFSIAIHDNKATKRKHYVSFPMTVGIGVPGDITAGIIQ
ncbi:MAG TPA: ethylbenzene dehydrogenase-related protein [Nitrospirota bacterium]|nr:ethylbenzene dehydrogenase-related protein [Nitrospirota bacterium]